MSMFPSINIAGTGLDVDQTWIDTIAGNVANADDASTPGRPAYRDQEVVAAESTGPLVPGSSDVGNGVQVTAIDLGPSSGVLTYDPSSPAADSKGDVVYPDVNIGHEMTSLVEAQVSYEADSNVLNNSDEAYKAVLEIKA